MILEGSWSTNITRYHRPYKGIVSLKKKIDFKKLELFKSLDTLNLASTLSFLNKPETAAVVAVVAPIEKVPPGLLAVTKKTQRSTAKISPLSLSKQKELQMDVLAKLNMMPVEK